MSDVQLAALAGRQFNRISRAQLHRLGLGDKAIAHRVAAGRLVPVRQGVFAMAPVLEDPWGRWMEVTLTAPYTVLSRVSAACAWGMLSTPPDFETVTRPGSGGLEIKDGILVCRSTTVQGEATRLRRVPITTVERTLLDLACVVDHRTLARAVRVAVREQLATLAQAGDALGRFRGRRGTKALAEVLARYAGLPIERARSGAEVRAMEILRDAARPLPALNVRIAGEEADLTWRSARVIIEIDGGPFHLDRGEDARKQAIWESAGYVVHRLPSDDVYERPLALLCLAPG